MAANSCASTLRYFQGRDDFNFLKSSRIRLGYFDGEVNLEVRLVCVWCVCVCMLFVCMCVCVCVCGGLVVAGAVRGAVRGAVPVTAMRDVINEMETSALRYSRRAFFVVLATAHHPQPRVTHGLLLSRVIGFVFFFPCALSTGGREKRGRVEKVHLDQGAGHAAGLAGQGRGYHCRRDGQARDQQPRRDELGGEGRWQPRWPGGMFWGLAWLDRTG